VLARDARLADIEVQKVILALRCGVPADDGDEGVDCLPLCQHRIGDVELGEVGESHPGEVLEACPSDLALLCVRCALPRLSSDSAVVRLRPSRKAR
jgi:hypothetical protein